MRLILSMDSVRGSTPTLCRQQNGYPLGGFATLLVFGVGHIHH